MVFLLFWHKDLPQFPVRKSQAEQQQLKLNENIEKKQQRKEKNKNNFILNSKANKHTRYTDHTRPKLSLRNQVGTVNYLLKSFVSVL